MTTSAATRENELLLPPPPDATREVGWWAMALVCATEGAFFAYLLASYFYLGLRESRWPPPGIDVPTLLIPGIMTVVLLASSAALYWGERGVERGDQRRLRIGTVIAIVLGITFLALQWREYHEKLRHFLPRTNAYGSIFYTTTSFHGTHVAVGVLLMLYMLLRAFRGHFTRESHAGVKITSLYWHFVDAVWLFIFASLYLSPRLYT